MMIELEPEPGACLHSIVSTICIPEFDNHFYFDSIKCTTWIVNIAVKVLWTLR